MANFKVQGLKFLKVYPPNNGHRSPIYGIRKRIQIENFFYHSPIPFKATIYRKALSPTMIPVTITSMRPDGQGLAEGSVHT